MKRPKIISLIFLLIIVIFIGFVIRLTGLLDFIPTLRVSAQSTDKQFTVMVYQQRLFPRPFFPRMGAIAKVYDKQGNLIFNEVIYNDDDWDDTVGEAYKQISFEADEIHIGPGAYIPTRNYIIKISSL